MIQVEIIHSNYSIESPICIEGGGLDAHCQSKEPEEVQEGWRGSLVINLFDVYGDYRLGDALLHFRSGWRACAPPCNFSGAPTVPSLF